MDIQQILTTVAAIVAGTTAAASYFKDIDFNSEDSASKSVMMD